MGKAYHSFDVNNNYMGYIKPGSIDGNINPKVSVILPIYNAGIFLDQAIWSVRNQTYGNLEIICINDGSTDSSLKTIEKHAAKDNRIIVIDKQNEGYGASCNRGLDAATGQWVSILEPDDWILPSMYEDMLEFASQFEGEIDIIKTPYWRIPNMEADDKNRLACSYAKLIKPKKQPFLISNQPDLICHHPSIWSAIYKKAFLDEFNIRFVPIPGAGWADNPFLMETMLRARGIVYLEQAYYCYRIDTEEKEETFSKGNPSIPFERWNEMMDIIESLGIDDPAILNAHYQHGFTYMSGIIMHNDPGNPEIKALVTGMFKRMKPELVFSNDHIDPANKRYFAELREIEMPKIKATGYAKNLVGKAIHTAKVNGPSEMIRLTKKYLKNRKSRTAGR